MTANPILRAALWMLGSVLSFTAMAIAGRALAPDLDTFEIMLFRSLFGIAMILVAAAAAGTLGQVSRRSLHIQAIRNLVHFAGQNLWLYAITVAPLAQVFALEFTQPLWAMPLSLIILGEALTRRRIGFALLGFVGILVITRPWAASLGPGVIPAAAAAAGFAGSAVFTRLLTRTESVTCILFWLVIMQAGLGLVTAGWDGDIALPSASAWPWVALVGFTGLFAHFCLTRALLLAPATVVIPIDFARLPLIAIVALVLYGEPFDRHVLAGAALIFAANYLNLVAESRARRRAPLTFP